MKMKEEESMEDNKKLKVLIVDDDLDFLNQHSLFLESEGFEVFKASSRKEAEEVLENLKPDLGVFDLMMEEEDDGFVLSYNLKKKYPEVPVIIVSAVTSETGLEFDTIGHDNTWIKADAMLPKPIRFEQLKREINRLCKSDKI